MSDQDLSPLSPALRALLEAEQSSPGIPTDRREALFSRLDLLAAPALEVPPAPPPAIPPVAAPMGAIAKVLTGKLVAVFVAGAAAGAGGYGVVDHVLDPVVESPVFVSAPVVEVPAPPAVVEVPTPIAPPPTAVPPTRAPERPVPSAPRAKRDKAPADASEERALVDTARTALQRGHPDEAATLLARHRQLFRDGQFDEEASALEVMALAGLRRPEDAREAAEKFRKRYPESLLGPAVEASVEPAR